MRSLVQRIRNETKRAVPDVDPNGPGARARVVMLMLTPGPADGGAQETSVLSPTRNSDQSALNLRKLMREARLDEGTCVFWNAVPWALDGRRDPTPEELTRGAAYLTNFLSLVPERRAAVALGLIAQRACRLVGIAAIEVPSPSPLAVAEPGARPNPKSERWVKIREGLARAGDLASR